MTGANRVQPDTTGPPKITWRLHRCCSELIYKGAPGGTRTHTRTLLRGLPLPIGLRGRRRQPRTRSGADLPRRRRDPLELGLGLVDLPERHDLAAEDQRAGPVEHDPDPPVPGGHAAHMVGAVHEPRD